MGTSLLLSSPHPHWWRDDAVPFGSSWPPRHRQTRADDFGLYERATRAYRPWTVTLESVLAQAERKLGSRKAVLDAIAVSRQRFHSAMRGGPPLHIERLLRLALVAGADPLETLRAGGRIRFAELLEEAAKPRLGETTITQRALLREFERLSEPTQNLIMQLVGGLAAERDEQVRLSSQPNLADRIGEQSDDGV